MRDTSRYVVGGVRYPSVTECLALQSMSDFAGIPVDVLEHARWRGTEVHRITAELDHGLEPLSAPMPIECIDYVVAYEEFRRETGFKPQLIEHVVVEPRHRYAGTLDRVGELNGMRVLIDLKCTATVQPCTALQTAGYALALNEPHIKRFALQLCPGQDPPYRLVPFRNQSDLLDWLAVLRAAWWRIRNYNIRLEDEEIAA